MARRRQQSVGSAKSNGARRAIPQFVLAGVVAMLALGVVTVLVSQRAGTDEAMRDARALTTTIARDVVAPALQPGISKSQPAAVAALDAVVRAHVLDGPVARIKLWSSDGRIVYSDDPSLIGTRHPLRAEEIQSLQSGTIRSEVSDLSKPENASERALGPLLEVYLPVTTAGGTRLLFESYLRYATVTSGARRIWLVFIPVIGGGLLLLEAVQIPLASRLVRRIRSGQRERERLMQSAVEASDAERRRIAADLHDGVVQDLAGMAFSLTGTADAVERDGNKRLAETLRSASHQASGAVRSLRSLLVEIYPPSLRNTGLANAISDLATPLIRGGAVVDIRVDPGAEKLPEAAEALVFRAAQEALRNVAAHARARRVQVSVTAGPVAVLEVVDDGKGFVPGETAQVKAPGHLGLRLLSDLAAGAGGRLQIDSAPGEGTRLRMEVPVT